ncbi:MAG TPA: AbrB/MazE/SpoVT family DNA-binding domain-containing protein [Pyrinomonadaceae bacterium]|jgi:antitoxin component of MazEF toxin-antitoxin module
MSRQRITADGKSATLELPQEILDELGVAVGDEVDLSVVNGTLILRPSDEAERAQKIEAATKATFERRRSAYEELAKGAD